VNHCRAGKVLVSGLIHDVLSLPVGCDGTSDPNLDATDAIRAEQLTQTGHQIGFQPPELGGPGRVVDGDDERAVAQATGPGVLGHALADQLRPAAEQRGVEPQRSGDAIERLPDPARVRRLPRKRLPTG
jgi:hypothetical protein